MKVPSLPRWLPSLEQGVGLLVVEGDGQRIRRRLPDGRLERAAEAAALEHPECTVRTVSSRGERMTYPPLLGQSPAPHGATTQHDPAAPALDGRRLEPGLATAHRALPGEASPTLAEGWCASMTDEEIGIRHVPDSWSTQAHDEVIPGSFAEEFVRGTREYRDAHRAVLDYYRGSELDRSFQEHWADRYALRRVVNDDWRIGCHVDPALQGNDPPMPPEFVPIRERIAAALARERSQAARVPQFHEPAGLGTDDRGIDVAGRTQLEALPQSLATGAESVSRVLVDEGDGVGVGTAWPIAVSPDGRSVQHVTAHHVVEGGSAVAVEEGPYALDAGVLSMDAARDVAVIDVPASTATPLAIAPQDPVVGDVVTMVGFPYGQYHELQGEVIDVTPADGDNGLVAPGTPLLTIAGDGGPGESGGPVLVNGRVGGHVIAGQEGSGIVYAVPISQIVPSLGALPQPRAQERHLEPAHEPVLQMAAG